MAIFQSLGLISAHSQTYKLTAETHDCIEKVRPGTGRETGLGQKVRPGNGRETGLGRAGVRAPKVGALGDAGSSCRNRAEIIDCFPSGNSLRTLRLGGEIGVYG